MAEELTLGDNVEVWPEDRGHFLGCIVGIYTWEVIVLGGTEREPSGYLRIEVTNPLSSGARVGEHWRCDKAICRKVG